MWLDLLAMESTTRRHILFQMMNDIASIQAADLSHPDACCEYGDPKPHLPLTSFVDGLRLWYRPILE